MAPAFAFGGPEIQRGMLEEEGVPFLPDGRADLARALREEPGRWALLDVTREEPIAPEHEFWALPNLTLTPHIAGVGRLEVLAYDDLLLDELDRWLAGLPLRHAVSKEQLETMA